MDLLLVGLIAVVAVAVVTALAQRLGVAGPLLLVAFGLVVGLLPFVEVPEIPRPDPRRHAPAAPVRRRGATGDRVRRDFTRSRGSPSCSSSSRRSCWAGSSPSCSRCRLRAGVVALGAILSPTDAVATSIAKRLGSRHA
jgi:CPA1 family monovalent cation:H+ antiporter